MKKRLPKIKTPNLNLLRGKPVSVMSSETIKGNDEVEGSFEQPLVLEGIFIYADENDLYLNTINDNASAFNLIVNRKKYTLIEIILADATAESRELLN